MHCWLQTRHPIVHWNTSDDKPDCSLLPASAVSLTDLPTPLQTTENNSAFSFLYTIFNESRPFLNYEKCALDFQSTYFTIYNLRALEVIKLVNLV